MTAILAPNDRDNAILDSLRAQAAAVCDQGSTNVALIDLPHFVNCGDSAILLGQLSAIRASHQDVRVTAHANTFRASDVRRVLPPGSTVYLQGGGSFGDLYRPHHLFRLAVIAALPDYRIVMMPQSCWFRDGRADHQTVATIRDHPDLTLYFRDEQSRTMAAAALGVACELAPDMACHLDVPAPRSSRPEELLWVTRHDDECMLPLTLTGRSDIEYVDWARSSGWVGQPNRIRNHAVNSAMWLAGRIGRGPTASRALIPLADRRMVSTVALLAQRSVVITERLHGHLLASLLGVPNVVIDRGYGKLSSFVQTWTNELSYVRVVADADDALRVARSLVET